MEQLISIIVPVYNVEKYIQICIESIKKQTYKNWELLLIDDGSKDRSLEICEACKKTDSRIKVFSQSNTGVSAARNKGLKLAEGAYVTFIDGDDYVHYDYLTQMYNNILKYNAEICNCTLKQCNSKKMNIDIANISFCNVNIYNSDVARKKYLSTHEFPPGVSGCLYSKVILENALFNINITHGEDFLFNWHCLCRANKILHINCALYYYVQYSESASHKFTENRLTEFEARKIFYKEICNKYPEYKKIALNFIFVNSCGIMMNFLDSDYTKAKEKTYNCIRGKIRNIYNQYSCVCCNYKYNSIWFLINRGYLLSYVINRYLIRLIKRVVNMFVRR